MTIPFHIGEYLNHPLQARTALLERLGQSGRVYRVKEGGGWVLLVHHNEVPIGIMALPPDEALERLEAHEIVKGVEGQDNLPARSHNHHRLLRALAACFADPLVTALVPTVVSVVQAPALVVRQGRLVRRPIGFDAVDGTLTTGGGSGVPPLVDPSYPHLRALWSGLLYTDPVYHANLLGYTVAMVARSALTYFPLLLLEGPHKSSGKSTVAEALGWLLQGRSAVLLAHTGNEDEIEKKLGGLVNQPGPNVVVFDNIRAKRGQAAQVRSQLLAIMSTSRTAYVRGVYRDAAPIFDPVVIMTMNGGQVEADLADRTVRVSITRPAGLVHRALDPHPLLYVQAHRGPLLAEILSILEGIELRPHRDVRLESRFYDFEQIATQAAAKLGLAASFSQAAVGSADAFLLELQSVMASPEVGPAPTLSLLVHMIKSNPSLQELNGFLSTQHVIQSALPRRLQARLEDVVGRQFRVESKLVEFSFGEVAGAVTLIMKEVSA